MPMQKLEEFLKKHRAQYEMIAHPAAYTAQEVAHAAHIPGREVAKTVIVKLDGKLAMAVLGASDHVLFSCLEEASGTKAARLASEDEFKDAFPGCDVGAMPPFGNLYGMDVYVADSLAEDEEIAFNACSHTQLIKLAYADFERLVKPTVCRFSATTVA